MPYRLSPSLIASLLVLWSALGHGQAAQPTPHLVTTAVTYTAALPDAPQAQTTPAPPAPARQRFGFLPGARNNPPVAPRWAKVIHPGQQASRLGAADKLLFALHEQINPQVFVAANISAGWEQLIDGNPQYGSDSAGFGERFGAAMLRQASGRLFADGVFAGLLREDPRYYRVGHGSYVARGLLSARQAVVRRTDSGRNGFNWSATLGHLSSDLLTLAYYPNVSATGSTVAKSFAISYAGDAAGNLFMEFLPDVFDLAFRRGSPHPQNGL